MKPNQRFSNFEILTDPYDYIPSPPEWVARLKKLRKQVRTPEEKAAVDFEQSLYEIFQKPIEEYPEVVRTSISEVPRIGYGEEALLARRVRRAFKELGLHK